MTTHTLLWNHATNTLQVATVAWMLSRGREAYTGDRPLGWVPVAMGTEEEMCAAATNCHQTLVKRGAARPDRLRLLDDPVPVAPVRAHFDREAAR